MAGIPALADLARKLLQAETGDVSCRQFPHCPRFAQSPFARREHPIHEPNQPSHALASKPSPTTALRLGAERHTSETLSPEGAMDKHA